MKPFTHFMNPVSLILIILILPVFYSSMAEVLPPVLTSKSEQPPFMDGITRLYISYVCPFAQRAWITRNYKGLQEKIKLVAIDLMDRPAWYKEKVYPKNMVPALEHDGKVTGESIDLIKYMDKNFEGPALLPTDPEKAEFVEEMLKYSDTFLSTWYGSLKAEGPLKGALGTFDHLETSLKKFDGPFFLGETFSAADIAFVPLVERFGGYFKNELSYDVTSGRPNLAAWIEEMDKIDAYKHTKCDIDLYIQFANRVAGKK